MRTRIYIYISTTSHMRAYIYINTISHARYIKIRNGTYDKTIISIVPSYTGKNNTSWFAVGIIT